MRAVGVGEGVRSNACSKAFFVATRAAISEGLISSEPAVGVDLT
jgi:hypothetical protein